MEQESGERKDQDVEGIRIEKESREIRMEK